jgi:hypothetical protein
VIYQVWSVYLYSLINLLFSELMEGFLNAQRGMQLFASPSVRLFSALAFMPKGCLEPALIAQESGEARNGKTFALVGLIAVIEHGDQDHQ